MSSLLARFAANIFWVGRYLERAENVARILDINETYARDKPEGPDWGRILELYADHQRYTESYARVTKPKVLNFYLLDRGNPTSIAYSVAAARENARTVRHLISTEMWTHLNIFHNQIGGLTRRDIRSSNVSRLCTEIKLNCQTTEGIAEGTLLRDEAWRYYQLGKYIERADQTTRILDIGYHRLSDGDDDAHISSNWNVLLRSVAGYHAYRARHPAGSYARDVATFFLYDKEFARAVALCVDRATDALEDLEQRHGGKRRSGLEKARRNLEYLLETGPGEQITPLALGDFLDQVQVKIGQLSAEIGRTYFGRV